MNSHIQHIEISNFKSIKDLKMDGCKKINIIAGKPNAGKSNLLEGLSLYDAINSKKEGFKLGNYMRFEHFTDLFFEGNIRTIIPITINNSEIIIFNGDELTIAKKDKRNAESKAEYITISKKGIGLTHENIYDFPEIVKKYSFESYRKHFFINNHTLNSPFGENISYIISSNLELRNYVNTFLKINDLKLLIERHTNELKIFKEYQDGTVFTLPYSMIADTLQRLIFYKAAIMSNENSVLLFEEPEAHCFEPYILEFTNEVKYNKNNNQFFIVTHSDFIMQEFLRDAESKANTQIYLVNNIAGETKVKALNPEGNEDVYEYGMNVFFNFDTLWANA